MASPGPVAFAALPKLHSSAAYLTTKFFSPAKRNPLSLQVLSDLRTNLKRCNTSPVDNKPRQLPQFDPKLCKDMERVTQARESGSPSATPSAKTEEHSLKWLVDSQAWNRHREGLPKVLVLRTQGPVFSAGHDLKELQTLSYQDTRSEFNLCRKLMDDIRRCPIPIVCVVQNLATAAGAQLALACDIVISRGSTKFALPGRSIGLPCTSPAAVVVRRFGPALTYRMLALGEPIEASQLPNGSVDVVKEVEGEDEEAANQRLEARIEQVVRTLAESPSQPQALGKWAFWTQSQMTGPNSFTEAMQWVGRVMAVHSQTEDAKEGIDSFLSKRTPIWKT